LRSSSDAGTPAAAGITAGAFRKAPYGGSPSSTAAAFPPDAATPVVTTGRAAGPVADAAFSVEVARRAEVRAVERAAADVSFAVGPVAAPAAARLRPAVVDEADEVVELDFEATFFGAALRGARAVFGFACVADWPVALAPPVLFAAPCCGLRRAPSASASTAACSP